MNDPGLDEPIQNTAQQVTKELRSHVESESPRHREPKSVKEAWLQEIRDDEDEEELGFYQPNRWWFTSTVFPLIAGTFGPVGNLFSVCALVQPWRVQASDPPWLIAVNCVSLFLSLLGNLFILFNFAHRVRYSIAQPLTISLWYAAAIFLLVPIVVIQKKPPHVFAQAYYYGLLSLIIYLTIATLLVFNSFGAYIFKAYPASFNSLTIPQRTLMLQTLAYVLYLALGAGIFSAVEGWAFVDALYWADYTLLTIGLGSDFPLQTNTGKGLLIPFAMAGIMMIGMIIGSIRALVLDRGNLKVKRRQLGKERAKWERRHSKKPYNEKEKGQWSKEEFLSMRRIENRAEKTRKYTSLAVALLAFAVLWFIGALVFHITERPQNWTYFQSLYFAYTSLTTIGFGDMVPLSSSGKPFFVIWSLIAVPTVTILISNLGDTVVGALSDVMLWIGQHTILPEGVTVQMKSMRGFKEALGREVQQEDASEENLRGDVERLGGAVEKTEPPGSLGAQLARQISSLAKDVGMKPPRKYDWEEWVHWLELLGKDAHADSDGDGVIWLADDGPLFSGETETEWLLGRLCQKLEKVLEEEKRA